jgi:hypothetical protein
LKRKGRKGDSSKDAKKSSLTTFAFKFINVLSYARPG